MSSFNSHGDKTMEIHNYYSILHRMMTLWRDINAINDPIVGMKTVKMI
ncbi:unnamed protein product [Arabidopsis halleri]